VTAAPSIVDDVAVSLRLALDLPARLAAQRAAHSRARSAAELVDHAGQVEAAAVDLLSRLTGLVRR
jgi:hypothetical protein